MDSLELIAPCHFGTEAVLKREIYNMGYDVSRVEDGRVFFEGDSEAVVRGNIWLRTAERVMINMAYFSAASFEELFDGVYEVPWENYIPRDGRFWVKKAASIKSRLHSVPDIQRIIKKAMVKRLGNHYNIKWFPEDGQDYPLRVTIIKDMVCIGLDTSGDPLHKRGYRIRSGEAPISETLAAALLELTPWKQGRKLRDPFCGSGTFLIEAAMREANIAPGINRRFLAENWGHLIKRAEWRDVRAEAREMTDRSIALDIKGSDIDPDVISTAKENAKRAKVDSLVSFSRKDIKDVNWNGSYGFVLTNPPYGERLGEREALPGLYGTMGDLYRRLETWSMYVITSYDKAAENMRLKPAKNRKIYNGMIRSYFYQFPGPKPPRDRT